VNEFNTELSRENYSDPFRVFEGLDDEKHIPLKCWNVV